MPQNSTHALKLSPSRNENESYISRGYMGHSGKNLFFLIQKQDFYKNIPKTTLSWPDSRQLTIAHLH